MENCNSARTNSHCRTSQSGQDPNQLLPFLEFHSMLARLQNHLAKHTLRCTMSDIFRPTNPRHPIKTQQNPNRQPPKAKNNPRPGRDMLHNDGLSPARREPKKKKTNSRTILNLPSAYHLSFNADCRRGKALPQLMYFHRTNLLLRFLCP